LTGLLEGKGLFFVNTVDSCYRLKLFLEQFSIRSAVLNAELPLNSRLHILEEYNRGIFDYLIATDASLDAAKKKRPKVPLKKHVRQEEQEDEEEEDADEDSDGEEEDGSNTGSDESEMETDESSHKGKGKKAGAMPSKEKQDDESQEGEGGWLIQCGRVGMDC